MLLLEEAVPCRLCATPINLLITSVLSFIRTIVILKKSLPGYAMAQNRFI